MVKINPNIAPGSSQSPAAPPAGTSDRVKCFRKHCLRCRKYFNHHHTPAEYNQPCILCPCTYFYGWEQYARKRGIKPEDFARMRKAPETTTQKIEK